MKFIEFLDFCECGGSKPLIFLRNYWCFCNVMELMKFHFSAKIVNFMIFYFFYILKKFNENALFLKKGARGAQDPPKCIVFHWFKQHSRQPAARAPKHDFSEKVKNFSALLMKKWKFHENHEIFKNFMIFDMSKHQVFPRKYLTKIKVPVLFRRSSCHFSKIWGISAFFRFWSPKVLFWAQNGTWASPAQNPS